VIFAVPAAQSIKDLRTKIAASFSPTRSRYEIYLDFAPTMRDLEELFGSYNAPRVRETLMVAMNDAETHKPFGGERPTARGVMTECYEMTKDTDLHYYGYDVRLDSGLYCRATWGEQMTLSGFFLLNEHWIWLP
jgi:hypothetical protein